MADVFGVLQIALWCLIALPFIGFAALWLEWGERQLRRRLAARPCLHCGKAIGLRAAAKALRSPIPQAPTFLKGEIDDGARTLTCPSCGRDSFFYRHTDTMTISYGPYIVIVPSPRPIPGKLAE